MVKLDTAILFTTHRNNSDKNNNDSYCFVRKDSFKKKKDVETDSCVKAELYKAL